MKKRPYVTDEEYAAAERRGISRRTVESRLRKGKWEKERALTRPTNRMTNYVSQEIIDLAESNGIDRKLLRQRILENEWDPVEAATRPVMTKVEVGQIKPGQKAIVW